MATSGQVGELLIEFREFRNEMRELREQMQEWHLDHSQRITKLEADVKTITYDFFRTFDLSCGRAGWYKQGEQDL